MGVHLDWSREYFTMDNQRSMAVFEAFKRLYHDGLIYRDMRIVSWCCYLGTAISDIEVGKTTATILSSKTVINCAVSIAFPFFFSQQFDF